MPDRIHEVFAMVNDDVPGAVECRELQLDALYWHWEDAYVARNMPRLRVIERHIARVRGEIRAYFESWEA